MECMNYLFPFQSLLESLVHRNKQWSKFYFHFIKIALQFCSLCHWIVAEVVATLYGVSSGVVVTPYGVSRGVLFQVYQIYC